MIETARHESPLLDQVIDAAEPRLRAFDAWIDDADDRVEDWRDDLDEDTERRIEGCMMIVGLFGAWLLLTAAMYAVTLAAL